MGGVVVAHGPRLRINVVRAEITRADVEQGNHSRERNRLTWGILTAMEEDIQERGIEGRMV